MDFRYTFKNGSTLLISQVTDPKNPRDFHDNLTTLICHHPRVDIGDKCYSPYCFDDMENLRDNIEDRLNVVHIQPLYAHGTNRDDIVLGVKPFRRSWHSKQVGFVVISQFNVHARGFMDSDNPELINAVIEAEIYNYNKYLRGEVFRFDLFAPPEICKCCNHASLKKIADGDDYYGTDWRENCLAGDMPSEYFNEFLDMIEDNNDCGAQSGSNHGPHDSTYSS